MKTSFTFQTLVLEDHEELLQLSGMANSVILRLERKRKLTPGEAIQLQFAKTLWENCKQLYGKIE